MPIELIVAKIPDRSIIEMFGAVVERFGRNHVGYNMGELGFQDPPEKLKTAKSKSYAISGANLNTRDNIFAIGVVRNHNGPAYFDRITITTKSQTSPDDVLELEKIIRSTVKFVDVPLTAEKESELAGLLEAEVASLAALHHSLISDALELRKTSEQEFSERRRAIEEQQSQAKASIATKEAESFEAIAAKQRELDEKLQAFDFSDHMRARRQLRESITEQVQGFLSQPVSSSQSRQKLLMIVLICLSGAVGSGWLAFTSFQAAISVAEASNSPAQGANKADPQSFSIPEEEGLPNVKANTAEKSVQTSSGVLPIRRPTDQTTLLWVLSLRGLALSVVTVGFLAYLVTFIRRSYDAEVESLRELQRYGMDINRASWVIETAMEMTTKEGAQLPEKWVEGACSGLFQTGSKGDGDVGSLAALGAVMGLGPEVSVGPEGASFKLPPRAAKKAAKDAA